MCVSIIVPVHNSEKYLRECIESALNQSFGETEILCIDGGSTDASFDIIEEMRKKDSRVKYLFDKNTSYGHKINVGIKNAAGTYIAILESDDLMSQRMIESLYHAAQESGADVVDADFYELFCYKGKKYRNTIKKYLNPGTYNRLIMCGERSPEEEFKAIWTALYRKDFLIKNDIQLNESEGASFQDSSFVFLVDLLADAFYHLDIPLYQYRIDNGGSSVKDDKKIFEIIAEYEFLKNDLMRRGIGNGETWKSYYKSKYDSFYWNYRRLSQKAREVFLERYVQELGHDISEDVIDRESFQKEYKYTFGILDDKERFVRETAEADKRPSMVNLLADLEKVQNRQLVVFGAGIWGTKAVDIIVQSDCNLCAICDNSESLQGSMKNGTKIISVEEAAKRFPEAMYLIASRKYGEEMKAQLLEAKIQEESVIVFA